MGNKRTKILIIILIIILIGAGIYYFTSDNKDESAVTSNVAVITENGNTGPLSETETTKMNIPEEGKNILNLLNQIKGVILDTDFFQSSAFKNLIDFSVELTSQPLGRDNPFAPLK
ncbi:MAG: hypothetical protein AB1643_03185 [Patescibacteria group bacterium]